MGKVAIVLVLVGFVGLSLGLVCPDARYRCPDTSTCCKIGSGYGCCPYPLAICCSDQMHCCPNRMTCDVSQSRCIRGGVPFPFSGPAGASWNEIGQTPILNVETVEVRDQACPGGRMTCPGSWTCCAMPGGGDYGCCPQANAVCCADGIHCCPQDKVCNAQRGSCDSK